MHEPPETGVPSDDAQSDGSLLGRFDAATLIAVERANGGEWAGLGQVLVTFKVTFGRLPGVEEFTESCRLLCEAGLIEYFEDGLGLTPEGRKLLRRAGSGRGARHPEMVAELLGTLDDADLAAEGSVPEPDMAAVASALKTLTAEAVGDLERVQASNATRLAPPMLIGNFAMGSESVLPLVPPDGAAAEDDAPSA